MVRATGRVGAALLIAAAGIAVTHGTSSAEPTAPTASSGHVVKYTLTSAGPYDFQLLYLTAEPPNKEAYNADAYSYVKRETINVGPDTPFVFETTLADPQWAILQASSTTKGGQAAPNAHCEITVDGVVAVAADHPYSPVCQLSQW